MAKWEQTKRYKDFMNDNWSYLLFNKEYSKLNAAGKKLVAKGIAGDKNHNKKDAKKIKNQNKELYKKAKEK